MRIRVLLLVSILLILSACSKRIIFEVPKDLTIKVATANKAVCSYKGRISVIYEKGEENVRFRGYLNKDCADNFRLKILGLFNTVAYDIVYEDGEVKADKKGEDVSLEMAYFMKSKGLDSMVSLIRYPHVNVDKTFKTSAVGDEFIMTKGVITVGAGEDYLIKWIKFGSNESFSYSYNEGKLSGLTYTDGKTKMEIKLR